MTIWKENAQIAEQTILTQPCTDVKNAVLSTATVAPRVQEVALAPFAEQILDGKVFNRWVKAVLLKEVGYQRRLPFYFPKFKLM